VVRAAGHRKELAISDSYWRDWRTPSPPTPCSPPLASSATIASMLSVVESTTGGHQEGSGASPPQTPTRPGLFTSPRHKPSPAGPHGVLNYEGVRVQSVTVFRLRIFIVVTSRATRKLGDLSMRVFLACAIIITATLGLGGCFHHEQAVSSQPLKLG
jgi:hypothetical protein